MDRSHRNPLTQQLSRGWKRQLSLGWLINLVWAGLLLGSVGGAPIVSQRVTPEGITVGTPITYTIQLRLPKGTQVTVLPRPSHDPDLELDPPNIRRQPISDADEMRVFVTFPGRLFKPGEHRLPAIAFELIHPDGSVSQVEAPPFPVRVDSILPPDARDILDIKPIRAWEATGRPRGYLVAWIGAVAVAGMLAAYRLRKRTQLPKKEAPPPPRPAHAIALESLRALEHSDLLAQGAFETFFVQLSEIARRYLEARYRIPALELTTKEILAALESRPLDPPDLTRLSECLTVSDLVKFARYVPSRSEAQDQLENLRQFIRQTRPRTDSGLSSPVLPE